MKSKKKILKKANKQDLADMQEAVQEANDAKRQKKDFKDSDLFSVNVNKAGLKAKREELKKDRFKRKAPERTSIAEENIVKKYQQNLKRRQTEKDTTPSDDIWGGATVELPKKKRNDIKFLKTQMNRVKPVMIPEGGHSYNPSAVDHKKVIKQVITEEVKQIESEKETHKALNSHLYKHPTQI
jgi:hypothetical protein